MMVQVPVPLRATVAEETPLAIKGLPTVQGPVVLKLTVNPLGLPFDMAVPGTVGCGPETRGETGKGPKVMVWLFLSTAGGDGGLWRDVEVPVSGARLVPIVYTTVADVVSGFV